MRFAMVSRETALHIEGLMLLQHMVASTRELVGECLHCERRVRVCFLAFVEAFGLRAAAAGVMRRLDERPRQIAITVLHIARPLLLAIGQALAVYAARVRSKVSHAAKALDRARLQHDR